MVSSDAAGSLEFPVMLHPEHRSAVMGIIERLTMHACRIRSLAIFAVGTRLGFELTIHGTHVKLSGIVTEVHERLPRMFYTVQLPGVPIPEHDALARAIEGLRERQGSAHGITDGGALVRASVRAPADFSVGYAIDGGGFGTGHVRNISTDGMLMTAAESLAVGTTLELSFAIAGDNVRKEIVTSARIVAHQQRPDGAWAHHIAFFNVDPKMRWEIAAYVERTVK